MNEHDLTSRLPRRAEDWPRAFVERVNAGDLNGAAGLYADEARFVAPSGGTLVGREAIRPVLAELIRQSARLSCRVVRAVTVGAVAGDGAAGDIAVLYTDFTGERRDAKGVVVPFDSCAIEVLRCEADGGWRLIVGDPQGRR